MFRVKAIPIERNQLKKSAIKGRPRKVRMQGYITLLHYRVKVLESIKRVSERTSRIFTAECSSPLQSLDKHQAMRGTGLFISRIGNLSYFCHTLRTEFMRYS